MSGPGASCGVIGLGFVGSCTLRYLAAAGMSVVGYDHARAAVDRLRARLETERPEAVGLPLSTDPEILREVTTAIVAVRLGRDSEGRFSTDALMGVARTLARNCRHCELVIIESTLPPGATRQFAAQLDRPDISVAHVPERMRIGDDEAVLRTVPRLVGGLSDEATRRACAFLERVGLESVPLSAPEVSELSKLLENGFLTTNIALIGEITRLAQMFEVSAHEVTAAAATKPHGFMAFHPGTGIGGHCLRNDLDLLRQVGAAGGIRTPMLDGIAEVARSLPELVLRRIERMLPRPLSESSIALVGVGFKSGSPDLTEAPSIELVRLLRHAGARLCYVDGLVPQLVVDEKPVPRRDLGAIDRNEIDLAVVVAGDRSVPVDELRRRTGRLLDAGGGGVMPGQWAIDERL